MMAAGLEEIGKETFDFDPPNLNENESATQIGIENQKAIVILGYGFGMGFVYHERVICYCDAIGPIQAKRAVALAG